jgi:predicted nucleotidyltransferase
MDQRTLHGAPILTLTTSEGDIDVMDRIAGIGDYAEVRKHSEKIAALGVNFRVLDLPSLIKAKRAAGRPRDFEHLPELEALLALRNKA